MFDGFRYTKTKDYITETEYENVDMIPCSAQTPRINQRIPGIFEDAQTYFKPGDPKCLTNMGEFLYYFLNQSGRTMITSLLIPSRPVIHSC